jgi:DeoR/GlpR family transcriptional regulator of sugar metabolism
MMKEQRIAQIQLILEHMGSIEIIQACEKFGVAPMTIRRDLEELEKKGIITRTHGGARLNYAPNLLEKPFEERLRMESEKKRELARMASSTIYSGEKVFIGSGSTMHFLTFFLDNSRRLLVVTNSLHIASELVSRTNITLIMVGGEIRSNTLSVTGSFANEMASRFKCDKSYMGITSIDKEGNLYLGSTAEEGILAAQLINTPECYIIADSTKLGKKDFVRAGRLNSRIHLITNTDADKNLLDIYKKIGAKILLA